ncbi:MAG: SDR family oxidoreductase [SAR202 cluster bacterium]|nr:SDR family oxidoreductase [SAR202 cluster bacterium]
MLDGLNLNGKTVLITGGGTGLGLEMVKFLSEAGADVCVAGRRIEPLNAAVQEVQANGRQGLAVSTDVSDSSQVRSLVEETLIHFGKIDVLINNAALVEDNVVKPIWDIKDEEWQKGLDVNLSGAFYCSREVAKHMADRGTGKIINTASGFGLRGGKDIYTYCCTKGGIIQLTKVLSFSLARYNITANTIVPGFIPTDATESEFRTTLPKSGEFLPSGELGQPKHIGPIAVFLASSASDYMTGEIFTLDGGGLSAGIAPTGYAPINYFQEV